MSTFCTRSSLLGAPRIRGRRSQNRLEDWRRLWRTFGRTLPKSLVPKDILDPDVSMAVGEQFGGRDFM